MSNYTNYSLNANDGRNSGGNSGRGRGRGNGSNANRNQNFNAVTGRSSAEGGGHISNSSGHRSNNMIRAGYRDALVREGSRAEGLLVPKVEMTGWNRPSNINSSNDGWGHSRTSQGGGGTGSNDVLPSSNHDVQGNTVATGVSPPVKQSVSKQKTALDPFDEHYCDILINDGKEVFEKAKKQSVVWHNGANSFGQFTLDDISKYESYFLNLGSKNKLLKFNLKDICGKRAKLIMENQEFREEKDKHDELLAKFKNNLDGTSKDYNNKVIECSTLGENIAILENKKCEIQTILDEKIILIEKMKDAATIEGVSGCMSVASGDRMGESDVHSFRAVFDIQTKHKGQLKDLSDIIAAQTLEINSLSEHNHRLIIQIHGLNHSNLTMKQQHYKDHYSPGNVQSVSTLGGESSVVNKGTAVDSTISRLNMNDGVHTFSGSGTKGTTDGNFPSVSEVNQSSNVQSSGKVVEGSLTDKANVSEKDGSNLTTNLESGVKVVEGFFTDKANVTENEDSNLNMNDTHVISSSGTKNSQDSNSLPGSKVIERSKDAMSLDMSKEHTSVDVTDPAIVLKLNDNMNMLEKLLPGSDHIVVDKAKAVVPPNGNKTDPVQIDDSVLPTSEVLDHVRDELELGEKILKTSEQNRPNNLSSSVQDLTSDDIEDPPNATVIIVTEMFGNYYVEKELLSNFRYPCGIHGDLETMYQNLTPEQKQIRKNLFFYVVNMRYLMTIGPSHPHYHLKSIFYRRCAQTKDDYFYGELKAIEFDDRVILHQLDWEKNSGTTYQDDDENNLRFIQNNHESFLLSNVESVTHPMDSQPLADHNYYDFPLHARMYDPDVKFSKPPTFINAVKGQVHSELISPIASIMHENCGFYENVK